MRSSRRLAPPRLARGWIPRTVAHIYCVGDFLTPGRSACVEGRYLGRRHWRFWHLPRTRGVVGHQRT